MGNRMRQQAEGPFEDLTLDASLADSAPEDADDASFLEGTVLTKPKSESTCMPQR